MTVWSRVIPEKMVGLQQGKKFSAMLWNPGGEGGRLLPRSQKPATYPFPEPHQSMLPTPLFEDPI